MSEVTIHPVSTPAELERFIRLPMRLSAGDPNYIAPLLMERREALSAKTNPFFAHAEVQMWLAVRDGRDVGRISAQIDALSPQTPDGVGHFGMIAAEDDREVFDALFRTAEAWLKARGRTQAIGPFNLSVNEEVGLLVEGHDTPPMLLMGHDPRYVAARVEQQGYGKAKDVFAYMSAAADGLPNTIRRRVRRGAPEGVTLRTLDMKRFEAEVRTLTEILNDAWADNWGFTPTTEAETKQLATAMRPIIDPRMTYFAEIDGETAGFMVMLPNVNEAIADLKGRLLPFGWAKLLWRLKVKGVKTGRVPLMGVRRKFASTHRGKMLPFLLIDAVDHAAKKRGLTHYELSWVLEDNMPMRRICEVSEAKAYKVYRLYSKALT
jgi:hypothetical protein